MKKTVMLAAIFSWLLVTGASAQWSGGHEYQPFLKEGKTWLVQYDERLVQNRAVPNDSCRYYLQGDTIINDQVYMKAYRQFIGSEPTYYAALRETDRKVSMIYYEDDASNEILLYNYDFKKGESYHSSADDRAHLGHYRVEEIKEISLREKTYLSQKIQDILIISWQSIYYYAYERIGSLNGPFSFLTTCTLLSCYEGDECLYEKGDEIKELEGIHSSQVISNDSDAPTYDLQGRRVAHLKQGGIYIQKGKKVQMKR